MFEFVFLFQLQENYQFSLVDTLTSTAKNIVSTWKIKESNRPLSVIKRLDLVTRMRSHLTDNISTQTFPTLDGKGRPSSSSPCCIAAVFRSKRLQRACPFPGLSLCTFQFVRRSAGVGWSPLSDRQFALCLNCPLDITWN